MARCIDRAWARKRERKRGGGVDGGGGGMDWESPSPRGLGVARRGVARGDARVARELVRGGLEIYETDVLGSCFATQCTFDATNSAKSPRLT